MRIEADMDRILDEANGGQPIWRQPSAWRTGLPMWAFSGRVFRGLAALLLWRTAAHLESGTGWIEPTSVDDPNAVAIPLRRKRGWTPILVTAVQRMAPLPLMVTRWDSPHLHDVLNELHLEHSSRLAPYFSHIRELAAAFLQALCRAPVVAVPVVSNWTTESLRIAANVGAFVADAAYARTLGKVFDAEAVWSRGDVVALFPWEVQKPGGLRQTSDRGLLVEPGQRILANGKRAGQLPLPPQGRLRLDRVWSHGRPISGYAVVLELLEALRLDVTGDPVLDTRSLGRRLAWHIYGLEKLPARVPSSVSDAWRRLLLHIKYKSWAHHLEQMTFADICNDERRWPGDRLRPRLRAVAKEMPGMTSSSWNNIVLARFGLVRLLDALGPKRPRKPPTVADVWAAIGSFPERAYHRYPIFKSDGGCRWLDVPNDKLARAQKTLMRKLRPGGPFAGVATAFEPGRSPAFHARIHEGAVAAVIVDIADFFGSIRPRHVRWAFHPRLIVPGKTVEEKLPVVSPRGTSRLLINGGTRDEREAILELFFAGDGKNRWLPQGAPSSPWIANLAAHPMDRRIRKWVRETGNVKYSRYADDLVISLHPSPSGPAWTDADVTRFLQEAESILRDAVKARGWVVQEKKTRRWRREDRVSLTLCGIEVPVARGLPCQLPREQHRRTRAAVHRLRCGKIAEHGLLAWAWGATGHPGWLAWMNSKLTNLAIELAGPVLADAFLAGWADSTDHDVNADVEPVEKT